MKKENPLWSFTSTQCENKFKDVRKSYTKIKDHNNQSGAELKTCKFYDEMEAVLGEKPIVKPISISSTLKKGNVLIRRQQYHYVVLIAVMKKKMNRQYQIERKAE